MHIRRVPVGLRLFLLALLVYSICPPFTSNDSYWTVPTALSLIAHGSTAVDEFVARTPLVSRHGLECVPRDGQGVKYDNANGCPNGHWYNWSPVGVSMLSAPLVLLMKLAAGIFAAAFPRAGRMVSQPAISAFLSGDLFGGHVLVELWCASTFGAITVWLQYRIASRFVAHRTALWLAVLLAFGTSEWSVASRNLYQHGLVALLLSAALYLAVRAREEPRWIALAGVPLALAFTVRPTTLTSIAAYIILVAVHYRAWLWRFLLGFVPVLAPFFAYNLMVRHAWLQSYYSHVPPERVPLSAGLAMYWFSPSRGLLIFTPVFVFSIAGMVLAWRQRWCLPLAPYLAAVLAAHSIAMAVVWDGHSYGPRYFADVTPLFTFFLIPVVPHWRRVRGPFLALALWGLLVHARGATSVAAHEWNAIPDVDPRVRVWDWKDPQFLRGLWH